MEQSNQPKMATPEQNAEFNRQLKDVLIGNGIALESTTTEGRSRHTLIEDSTYQRLLNVIDSLITNTGTTEKVWETYGNCIQLNTRDISKQQDEILELKTLTKALQLRIESLERKEKLK